MAKLDDAHMLVHINWDTEPTDGAKALIQLEVNKTLEKAFNTSSWFKEIIRAEVHKALDEERIELGKAMYRGSQLRRTMADEVG
jgi:hypothetical protein